MKGFVPSAKILPVIIAIDGFSSCGKSTLAKDLASSLNFTYLDSGAMYRAVTLYFIENNIPYDDKSVVINALDQINIEFEKGSNRTILNGIDVESEIRSPRVTEKVSPVSTVSEIRRKLVAKQRLLAEKGNMVMDGRDIGTVVFPNAELKIFLTASKDVRTQRRFEELKRKGFSISWEEVRKNLLSRDKIDSSREDSPLSQAPDAVLLDNSNLSRKEQNVMVVALAKLRQKTFSIDRK